MSSEADPQQCEAEQPLRREDESEVDPRPLSSLRPLAQGRPATRAVTQEPLLQLPRAALARPGGPASLLLPLLLRTH